MREFAYHMSLLFADHLNAGVYMRRQALPHDIKTRSCGDARRAVLYNGQSDGLHALLP